MIIKQWRIDACTALLAAFAFLFLLIWANEIFDLPNYILGKRKESIDWSALFINSIVLLLVTFFSLRIIRKISKKEHQTKERFVKQERELNVRQRIIEATIGTLELEERLSKALEEITKLTDVEKGVVYLLQNKRFILYQQCGFSDDSLPYIRDIPVGNIPFHEEIIYGWNNAPDLPSNIQSVLKQEGIRKWLFLPMKSKNRIIGFCLFASCQGETIHPEEIRVLKDLVDSLAIIVWEACLYRQTQERLARLTTLREVDRAISAQLSLDNVIQVVLEKVLPHIKVDAVGMSLMDWKRKRSVLNRMYLPGGVRSIEKEAFELSDSLLAELGVQKKAVMIYDVKSDPRLQNYHDIIRQYNLCSYIGVPLVVQDQTIGVLHLFTCTPHFFSDEDVDFFITLAGQAAIAVQNARMYEAAVQRARGMNFLARFTLNFSEFSSEEELIQSVLAGACKITGAKLAAYLSYYQDSRTLKLTATVGFSNDDLTNTKNILIFRPEEEVEQPVNLVALKREAVYVSDTSAIPHFIKIPGGPQIHSAYIVPLFHGEHLFGIYAVLSREVDAFTLEQRSMADLFATSVSTAMENARLLHETQQAYEKLKNTHTQLLQAQKMEAIGTLAGGVAHDFNNLLTAILGYTDFAMMKIDEANPLYRYLKQIHLASIRAAGLTRQLLLFSRKQPMERTLVKINKIIDNLLKMLNRLIGEDIAISTYLEPDLWIVHADEGNIEQVIMNLVVNARDAMPKGGNLTIKTENVSLNKKPCNVIAEAQYDKFICLSIEDTGAGMDKETVQHIFEPFFSTKEVGKGTGLGLSVVYGIIKQHDGWINVYSEPGQGSTFKVYLPAFSVKLENEAKDMISLQKLQGNGERILLVEDEEGVRELVTRALRENGYIVFKSKNSKDALDVFEREKRNFHMALCDVVLPDQSGLQLADQLLSRKPELRILLSSGYTDEKSQWSVIFKKGFRFIQKPYTIPNLLHAIKEILEPSLKAK